MARKSSRTRNLVQGGEGGALTRPGERRTENGACRREAPNLPRPRNAPAGRRARGGAVVSGENWNRKDARGGANRFGLHRSLCGFAADRDRRPPFRAVWSLLKKKGRGVGQSPTNKTKLPSFQTSISSAIAWKSQGRRDQRERWSPQGFHARPSLRKNS